MPAALILNQSQAEAVYSAMCALNNVSGRIGSVSLPDGRIVVNEFANGRVLVNSIDVGDEAHTNQGAFATAYGLNSDEPQTAVAAAAGGLTQTAIER